MMWDWPGTTESWLTLVIILLVMGMWPVFYLGKRWGMEESERLRQDQ